MKKNQIIVFSFLLLFASCLAEQDSVDTNSEWVDSSVSYDHDAASSTDSSWSSDLKEAQNRLKSLPDTVQLKNLNSKSPGWGDRKLEIIFDDAQDQKEKT